MDKTAKAGVKYRYYTLAHRKYKKKNYYSARSPEGSIIKPKAARFVRTGNYDKGILLAWHRMDGATGYTIYYKKGNKWKKLLTTKEMRKVKMTQLRPVSKTEKIIFPILVTIFVILLVPDTAPLIGMLMLGNLFRESGVVRQLVDTASNALMYIVVILLGTSVGATTSAEAFLNVDTVKIVILGLVAFAFGTAGGVLLGKLMCVATHGKVNPLIGSAGVSAVPMAARVSQKVGAEADPTNFLLMHAMGPNVAGVIGTAVVAGTFMAIFGVF